MTINRPTPAEAAAKREGYVKGRDDENYIQRIMRRRARVAHSVQVKESSGTGVILGLVIATLAAIVGGLFFFANTDNTDVVPVAVPDVEREITTDVDLPDVQVNVPEVEVEVPEVNITETTPDEAAE